MNLLNIELTIKEKQDELDELSKEVVSRMKEKKSSTRIKFNIINLQKKLERRVQMYENQLLDEKIAIYKQVLNELE